jgi:hypothetical protein
MFDPGLSRDALALYRYVRRCGGSLRIVTLLRQMPVNGLTALGAAIDELAERYWIRIAYREPRAGAPPDAAGPLDHIERLVTTRFGRRKYRATWRMD